jgi:hypothetical protein
MQEHMHVCSKWRRSRSTEPQLEQLIYRQTTETGRAPCTTSTTTTTREEKRVKERQRELEHNSSELGSVCECESVCVG